MSIEAMAIALHHSRSVGTARVVLFGIANHVSDAGAWPSNATLARYANVTDRSVQRALTELEDLGEIRRHIQKGGTSRTPKDRVPNLYEFLLTCPRECDRSMNHRTAASEAAPERLSTGVTPVSPRQARGVTPVSPRGVTPVSPEPYLEPTTYVSDRNSRVRAGARARRTCPFGHDLIDDRHCDRGCPPDAIAASA